ncbi:hypothetical protein PVK06_047166 [Gossypium arboreum]|uniref:Pectate lyase n=1 Tax=Gossypium arboreum TaxID=29729 RepID=A0ABR0MCP1_GOSAR|nr:hypothetical protein PVK06_047166 [Gossypium arboreum]
MGITGYSYSWFLLSFFVLIPTLEAHIAKYDEYWKARELEATENLNKAYHPNPEENRKRLADCAPGFARGTVGGKDGKFYMVTNPSDDIANPKPETLRHAFARNVIIHGLHIHHIKPANGGMIRDAENHIGLRTASDGDGISLFGATNIWLDHLSLYDCSDGLIDVIQGSTAITISNCHFTDHTDVMLFGASDSYVADEKMQITVALNHFGKGLGNRYSASGSYVTKEVTSRGYLPPEQWKKWNWVSQGDQFKNGAYFTPSGDPNASKLFGTNKMMPFQPGQFVHKLTRYAGTVHCRIGRPC